MDWKYSWVDCLFPTSDHDRRLLWSVSTFDTIVSRNSSTFSLVAIEVPKFDTSYSETNQPSPETLVFFGDYSQVSKTTT